MLSQKTRLIESILTTVNTKSMNLNITSFTFLKIPLLLLLGITFTVISYAQTGNVSGTISKQENGEAIIGVQILVKGTRRGAYTDENGKYTITAVPVGLRTLIIQGIGYNEKEQTVNVVAGETVEQNIQLSTQDYVLGEVVVTGLRKSQLDAVAEKKRALNNINVLSTNDIGRLPDINVAEAAQRIPGVSIETDNGEGRFISIRGIQPSLNNVTMNNSNIGSTAAGRETPLDLLPIEMIGSIEVTKANTPDMEGNAIGGAININTITAYDRPQKQFLIASFDGLVQEQQAEGYGDDKFPYRAAVTLGKRFGEQEKFGVVVSGNYFFRDFSVSILDPDRWQILRGTDPQGNPSPGYLGPNEIEIQIEDNERERYGATADFQFRPTPNTSIYLRGLYTHTDEIDFNSEFELTVAGLRDQMLTDQTPTTGRFSQGSGELDLSSADVNEDLYSLSLGTRNTFGNFSFDMEGTFSRADQSLFNIDGTYENDRDEEFLLASTYDIEPFFFDITAVDLETARDPSIYYLRSFGYRAEDGNSIQEDLYEGTLNAQYDFKLNKNANAFIKAGTRFRRRDKAVDRSRNLYDDDNREGSGLKAIDRYTLEQFNLIPVINPVQGGALPNVHGDAFAFRDFFGDETALMDTTKIFLRPEASANQEFVSDVNYREDVTAGYVMGVLDFPKLTITAGVRIEHTSTVASPFVDQGDGFNQVDFENSYTNVMPSIHLRANPTNNLITRLSWTNTIGRPDYDQLSGASVLNFDETATPGIFTGRFEGANPFLDPLEAMNIDLSIEYYFKNGGLASIGGFFKDIDNQIFTVIRDERNQEFNGLFFEDIVFTRDINLNSAQVYGFEAGYDQALTFLPSPFDGFGITANVAFIESEAEYPNRPGEDLPLFRQPSSVFNIIPYYQKYGVEFRVAVTYRSDFIVAIRDLNSSWVEEGVEAGFPISDFDRYEGERTSLDITAAYTFPWEKNKLKVLFQARNLTNAPEQEYQGNSSRYDRHQLFGRSFFLGASVSL